MEGNAAVAGSVEDLIAERLSESGLASRAANLVLAAVLGDEDLDAVLSGESKPPEARQPTEQVPGAAQPTGLYLRSVQVEGFRGIGQRATLRLQPGPGLTIVAGRNGSGKSSFAEAAELALTGDNKRWSGHTAVWREGWRNLHTTGGSRIAVELAADGQKGSLTVTRDWPADADLDGAQSFEQAQGQPKQPLSVLNLSASLETFRPFLSYSELGALISGTPSAMYDALEAILGLEQLIGAQRRLDDARKRLGEPSKQAEKALRDLRSRLEAHPDPRATAALEAVRRRPWKLDVIEKLAVGAGADSDPLTASLTRVGAISLPPADYTNEAISELAAASAAATAITGTPAADARRLAGLLTTALGHHRDHPGEPCPVCGGKVLDERWAEDARTEIKQLTSIASEAEAAERRLTAATRAVRDVLGPAPTVLTQDFGTEIDTTAALRAWESWARLAADASADELSTAAAARYSAVATAVADLQALAADTLKRRSDAWQPTATQLASWTELARSSEQAEADLADVQQAIDWLKTVGQEIRDDRMAPLTDTAAEVWGLLRQESNVELGPVRLEGSANRRHVTLDVNVDGVESKALSVMSQGELHALGLALFLPRATSEASPFRFIVIDDPVQSMDPAKVDGLARLLAKVGQDRQVVVFTHDDRLPEAVRRLQLPATIWEVVRREGSIVELTKNEDPVRRYLADAWAIAQTEQLPSDARALATAGFCRSALEAACHEAIRARRIKAGVRHSDVERELAAAETTHDMLTLALLDDAKRGGDLYSRIKSRHGQAAVDAFHAIKSGPHVIYQGDLKHLVKETQLLANAVGA